MGSLVDMLECLADYYQETGENEKAKIQLTIAAKVLAAFQDDFLTKWMRYTIYEDKKEDLDRIEERLRNLNNV